MPDGVELWPAPGDDLSLASDLPDALPDFSCGASSDLLEGGSMPIWLQVWASSASGLFLASSCNTDSSDESVESSRKKVESNARYKSRNPS